MGTVQPKKGGRPRSGSVEPAGRWEDGSPRFRVRVRLADGTKSERYDVPHAQDAKAYAAYLQAKEDQHHGLLLAKQSHARARAAAAHEPHPSETADAWFTRYLPTKECGATHRRISADVWKKWISPIVGPKPIAALTRDDVEDVRDRLDTALDAKEIRHSTARNAWGVFTGALKSAYAARDRSLRVHAAPLHFGVLPPKRGDSRQRPWLYPREWAQLVACDDVPVAFRQLYALALYTGLRPGELRALTWGDVDAGARTITVSKAYERESDSVKAPKTLQGRRIVPVHEHLAPLLEKLRGAKPTSRSRRCSRSSSAATTASPSRSGSTSTRRSSSAPGSPRTPRRRSPSTSARSATRTPRGARSPASRIASFSAAWVMHPRPRRTAT